MYRGKYFLCIGDTADVTLTFYFYYIMNKVVLKVTNLAKAELENGRGRVPT